MSTPTLVRMMRSSSAMLRSGAVNRPAGGASDMWAPFGTTGSRGTHAPRPHCEWIASDLVGVRHAVRVVVVVTVRVGRGGLARGGWQERGFGHGELHALFLQPRLVGLADVGVFLVVEDR